MSPSNEQQLPDIASELDQLGETTTAKELVLKRGQNRKLKVISEKKLMEWIQKFLTQQVAGKPDAFSDREKAELVEKMQGELSKHLKREQEMAAERDRLKQRLDAEIESAQSSAQSQADKDAATILALKKRLEEEERAIEDLQHANEDLHDKLSQHSALLHATIEEKERDAEKLQITLRNQMVRSTGLLEGVLGLDNAYYAGRHQSENPASDEVSDEERFFHDFEIGANVIATLSGDLERLRALTKTGDESAGHQQLLESDLALIAQLKEGSLAAMDVAQPVASLVAALEGTRSEVMALHDAVDPLGLGGQREAPLSEVPDSGGKPAEVLAGATTVVREVATLLTRDRGRIAALKQMADEADEQRNRSEGDLDALRAAYDSLLASVAGKAAAERLAVPAALADAEQDPAVRSHAAIAVIERLHDNADGKAALADQVRALQAVLAQSADGGAASEKAPSAPQRDDDQAALLRGLSDTTARLEQRIRDQRGQLVAANRRERDLATQIKLLATARAATSGGDLDAEVHALNQALASAPGAAAPAEAAANVVAALTAQEGSLAAAAGDFDRVKRDFATARTLETQLASQVRDLAKTAFAGRANAPGARKLAELDNRLAQAAHDPDTGATAPAVLAAAQAVVDALRSDGEARQDQLRTTSAEIERARVDNATLKGRLETADAELAATRSAQSQLATQLRDLGRTVFTDEQRAPGGTASFSAGVSKVAELDHALDQAVAAGGDGETSGAVLASARGVVEILRRDAGKREERLKAARIDVDRLHSENSDLRNRLDTLGGDLAAARSRAETLSRSQIELSSELVRAAKGDADLADTAADLALTIDNATSEPGASDLAAHAKAAIVQLTARKQSLVEEINRARTDAVLARRSGEARATGLEQEIQRLTGEHAGLSSQLAGLRDQLTEARSQYQALTVEHEETAATGREIIAQLTHQRDTRDHDLHALRAAESQLTASVDALTSRVTAAETANRDLADTLAALVPVAAGRSELADARGALELALGEVPGELGVPLQPAVAERLSAAARDLIRRLGEQADAQANDLAAARMDISEAAAARSGLAARLDQLQRQTDELREQLHQTESERDEMAASGKEVIAQLTSQRVSRDGELADARRAADALRSQLEATHVRVDQAEAGNRRLAEALSAIAAASEAGSDPAIDEARVDLELALSELPDEGETGVTVPADLGNRLAEAGARIADGVRSRQRDLAANLARERETAAASSSDAGRLGELLTSVRANLGEREAALKRTQAELAATQHDLNDQAAILAGKTQELSKARSELASTRSDLDGAQAELAKQDEAVKSLSAQLGELRRDHSELNRKLQAAQTRLAASDQAQTALTAALKGLATWEDHAEVGHLLAGPKDVLGKAAARLGGDKAEVAPAFVHTLRERIKDVAIDLGEARTRLAALEGSEKAMHGELSAQKAALMAREHDLENMRNQLVRSGERAFAAEAAARALAGAIHQSAANDKDKQASEPFQLLSRTLEAHEAGKPLAAAALADAGVQLIGNATARFTRSRDERARLEKAVKDLDGERATLRGDLAQARERLTGIERELTGLRSSEQALAESAAGLSREILIAAKAMVSDADPARAATIGKALSGFDRMGAAQRVASAADLMPAVREHFTNLAIDLAESRAQTQSASDQHARQLAELKSELDAQRGLVDSGNEALARAQHEHADGLAKLMASRRVQDETAAELKAVRDELLAATAELDDFKARGASAVGLRGSEQDRLALDLEGERQTRSQLEQDLANLRERLESTEAKARKQRDDLSKRLDERDALVASLEHERDDLRSRKIDEKGQEAEHAALKKELAAVHERLKEYERTYGEHAGVATRTGDLAKELKGAHAERDRLREEKRRLESDLAEAEAEKEEQRSKAEERKKEIALVREKKDQEIATEREKVAALREEARQLKQDNVGLKARLRRFSGGGE